MDEAQDMLPLFGDKRNTALITGPIDFAGGSQLTDRPRRHPDIVAFEKWLHSPEGIESSDPSTLGAEPKQRRFLENRLWFAFKAGMRHDG